MLCPAVYPPDPTLGITDPQMLPDPKVVPRSRNYPHRPCPKCGKSCPRDRVRTRTLHDLGDPLGGGPVTFTSPIRNTTASGASTTSPPTYPAWPHPRPATPIGSWPWPSGWSSRTAYPIRPPVGTSGATTASSSPSPPSRTGSRPGEKRRPTGSGPTTSIGPSTASRDTSPLMSYMTAPSASCRSSTTAPSGGSVTRSSTTPRLTGISGGSSAASGRP